MPSEKTIQAYTIKSVLNQFENEGPRTNNHAEGHNFALNKSIGQNPNFYKVIEAIKTDEVYQFWKWLSNKGGKAWSKPRRKINIQRDITFQKHNSNYRQGKIDLITFIRSISYMFELTTKVNKS